MSDVVPFPRRTAGTFESEVLSASAFDRLIERDGFFRVYREVQGYYIAQRPGCRLTSPRIDRILQPTPAARDAGWPYTIGVELKASDKKLGPAVCQAIDYTWGIFRAGTTWMHPEAVFIWPLWKSADAHYEWRQRGAPEQIQDESIYGAIESVMLNNRVGMCHPEGDGIVFRLGATRVLEVFDGVVTARPECLDPVGRKRGSR